MRDEPFQPFVYLPASKRNGTLYCGSTSRPIGRIWAHKQGLGSKFTARYGCKTLVWYEVHSEMEHAIQRELRIKEWRRKWKLDLIESFNPDWRDLYPDIL